MEIWASGRAGRVEGRAPHGAERKPEGWSEHRAARWSRGAEKACGPDPLSQRVQEGGQGWGAVLGPVGAGREQTQHHGYRKENHVSGLPAPGYLMDRISPRAPQVWELLLYCSVELF